MDTRYRPREEKPTTGHRKQQLKLRLVLLNVPFHCRHVLVQDETAAELIVRMPAFTGWHHVANLTFTGRHATEYEAVFNWKSICQSKHPSSTRSRMFLKCNRSDSPLGHCIHVNTHRRHFAAAVLVELVATRLTSEAIKKKLVAKITVSQFEKGFPYLWRERRMQMFNSGCTTRSS